MAYLKPEQKQNSFGFRIVVKTKQKREKSEISSKKYIGVIVEQEDGSLLAEVDNFVQKLPLSKESFDCKDKEYLFSKEKDETNHYVMWHRDVTECKFSSSNVSGYTPILKSYIYEGKIHKGLNGNIEFTAIRAIGKKRQNGERIWI